MDAINLGNILHQKSRRGMVSSYFKYQSVPTISYRYASSNALKIFNYRRILQDFSINNLNAKPPDCSCHNYPFKYSPAYHVITGDGNITDKENIRKILA